MPISPINGNSFVYQIESTTNEVFHQYLVAVSKYKLEEIIIIDNAGFHSMKNYKTLENIKLIRNPFEKI